MPDLTCPHCHQTVPAGASVCRGCQAEITYGAPRHTFLIMAILSVLLGVWLAARLPASLEFIAWGAGIGALIAGGALIQRVCRGRIRFHRIYRTR